MNLWSVPKMWQNATVYILGGGPSLAKMDLTPIHDKRVIGVNNSFKLGDWVDVCWWGDSQWFDWNRDALEDFAGLKVHCCPRHKCVTTKQLLRGKPKGIDKRPTHVSWNLNSGASAINLAYHFGAKKIVLLGFDMKFGASGENNWHNEHKRPVTVKYNPYPQFLESFPVIHRDAISFGIEIVNATPDSALTVFPMVTLEETL